MQVVFNGRFLTRRMTGVDRVALNLIRNLDLIWPVSRLGRFCVAVPPGAAPLELQHGDVQVIGQRQGLLWEQWDLPRAFPDAVLINLCNSAALLHRRNVVLIHDANVADFPASYSWRFRLWYQLLLRLLARRALRIATVSRHSADRLMAHRMTPRRAKIIANGCDHFDPRRIGPASGTRDNTILFVGSPARHKNLDLFLDLAERFETEDLSFKIVGATAGSVFAASEARSARGNVDFLGPVDEDRLIQLLQFARALIFPSFVEGFGLTPLEAQLFGCPVISSNRNPMQETLASTALFADPERPDQWESALRRLLTDADLWESLSKAGRANAARFTWQAAAREWLALIVDACAAESIRAPKASQEQDEICTPL